MIKHPDFALPEKKALLDNDKNIRKPYSETRKSSNTTIVDYYGKKKRHTLKAQLVVNKPEQQVVCTAFGKSLTLSCLRNPKFITS